MCSPNWHLSWHKSLVSAQYCHKCAVRCVCTNLGVKEVGAQGCAGFPLDPGPVRQICISEGQLIQGSGGHGEEEGGAVLGYG